MNVGGERLGQRDKARTWFVVTGFEHEGGSHEPRDEGNLEYCNAKENDSFPGPPGRNSLVDVLILNPEKHLFCRMIVQQYICAS